MLKPFEVPYQRQRYHLKQDCKHLIDNSPNDRFEGSITSGVVFQLDLQQRHLLLELD